MNTWSFQGPIKMLQDRSLNLDLLFNTQAIDDTAKTSAFAIDEEPEINEEDWSLTCGVIDLTCADASDIEVTANFPLSVGNMYPQCKFDVGTFTEQRRMSIMANVANRWVLREAKYMFNDVMYPEATIKAYTEEITKDNVLDAISALIGDIEDTGITTNDINIVVSPKVARMLALLQLHCCDATLRTRDMASDIIAQLNVKGVYVVPASVLPADVKIWGYIHAWQLAKRYCASEPEMIQHQKGDGHTHPWVELIGAEFFGGYSHEYGKVADGSNSYATSVIYTDPAVGGSTPAL